MRPEPCFENKALEEAARQAEERKRLAIERLTEKLASPRDEFGWPLMKGNGDD